MAEGLNLKGYSFGNKLGAGSFSSVYIAKATSGPIKGENVAVKCIKKNDLSQSAIENILTEIKLLKTLHHNNIVKMFDFTWNESYIFIIMEYCEGGDLLSAIKAKRKLSQEICQKFLQQVAIGLKYLREKNISHLDLKPRNILLSSRTNPTIKIADFGLSGHLGDHDTESTIRGSPLYMAPEILLRRSYNAKVDLWSVGVILYECLFGRAPFISQTNEELVRKIKSEDPVLIPPGNLSDSCRDLLERLLQRDPEARISFDEFFTHPYIDLEHAPCSESYAKAVCFLNDAVEQDLKHSEDQAVRLYSEGLTYLRAAMQYECDLSRRMAMKNKYLEYRRRLENLKRHSKAPLRDPGVHTELVELSRKSPSLLTAVEIAMSGDLYMLEGSHHIALEKYTVALEKLIQMMSSEPEGPRKKLLSSAVMGWMKKAEEAKILCSAVEAASEAKEASRRPDDCDNDRCGIQ